MSTLPKRIDVLEQSPQATRAQRIARARATGDLSELTHDELNEIAAATGTGGQRIAVFPLPSRAIKRHLFARVKRRFGGAV
jgi:hypothetical protein